MKYEIRFIQVSNQLTYAFVLGATLFAGVAEYARGDALTEDQCNSGWAEYVKKVDNVKSSDKRLPLVLFVGADGSVFDCFGEDISSETKNQIQLVQKSLS